MELYYGCERLHIVPALGMMPIKQVTPIQIQTLLYQLQSKKQLSHRTITLVRSILTQMFDYAIDMGLVENNPARNAKVPKQPRSMVEKEKVISIAQREALLKAAETDEIMCPILTMLMLTGMRIGEVLALQWKHIDFVAKTISICQSLTREVVFDEDGKTQSIVDTIGATKTQTSHRQIQAPDLVLERLRRWMQYVAKRKGGLDVLVPDGFVFVSTRTMKMRTYSGFRASYRHFLDRSGFGDDNLNLHRYRHTYASMLLEQGINPKVVQKLLGHRDVSTTLGVYSHVVPEVFPSWPILSMTHQGGSWTVPMLRSAARSRCGISSVGWTPCSPTALSLTTCTVEPVQLITATDPVKGGTRKHMYRYCEN